MPLRPYGVLKGKVVETRPNNGHDRTPHYEVHIKGDNKDYRIAINIMSKMEPSELLYSVSEDFNSDQICGKHKRLIMCRRHIIGRTSLLYGQWKFEAITIFP